MTTHGQHTGALIADLPVIDLVARNCGKWNGNIDLKKSKIVTFQGEKVLQVHHDKGSGSTATDPRAVGGVQGFFTPPGLPLADGGYVFGFDVFFPTGYKFAKGGKFGGVYMGEGSASGGHHSPNASSNRIMFQVDGGAILYVYPPLGAKQADPRLQGDPDYGFGVFNKEFAKCLKTGQWNHLEIGTKMNTYSQQTILFMVVVMIYLYLLMLVIL
jgi:hypothetical protein